MRFGLRSERLHYKRSTTHGWRNLRVMVGRFDVWASWMPFLDLGQDNVRVPHLTASLILPDVQFYNGESDSGSGTVANSVVTWRRDVVLLHARRNLGSPPNWFRVACQCGRECYLYVCRLPRVPCYNRGLMWRGCVLDCSSSS